MKTRISFLKFLSLMVFSCNEKEEEDDGWNVCSNCNIDDWIGIHTGSASYYNNVNNETTNNIDIEIEQTVMDYLCIYLHVPDYYSATLCGDFIDPYSLAFASSSYSFSATIYKKDNQYKLSGNTKRFEMPNDTTIVYKETVNFEVFKQDIQ